MSAKQLIIANGKTTSKLLRMTLDDFSPADMLKRPVPLANHVAWQLSHVIKSSASMLGTLPGAAVPPVPDVIAHITKEHAQSDDPAMFASKEQLLDTYDAVLSAMGAAVNEMDDAALGHASPEKMAAFAPTHGDAALLIGVHMMMHVGQVQVIRRSLGKPVLF